MKIKSLTLALVTLASSASLAQAAAPAINSVTASINSNLSQYTWEDPSNKSGGGYWADPSNKTGGGYWTDPSNKTGGGYWLEDPSKNNQSKNRHR
ncbi:hypothetical protein JCM19231_1719 [Vibrio ishigakensis]|uniref:Uncharacterized protein n=1 Tax=Vibrio ishigakensis TaxID=1481914 RepID=A0A0B8P7C4_9VIBR|nr:hypothetical protein [Vibrio ishigakensis]GAM59153.1 hypothetical protein JCM19231_1719 [Vibrio ishigakensis]